MLTGGQAGPLPTLATADDMEWYSMDRSRESECTYRSYGGFAGASGTSALVFGGNTTPGTALTEQWNGTSWTEIADLAAPTRKNSGGGTTTAAITVGNETPNTGAVEEWNDPVYTIKTVTLS